MKPSSFLFLFAVFVVLAVALQARGTGVDTSDPNLPVLSPVGYYTNSDLLLFKYGGGANTIRLHDVTQLALNLVDRTFSGANEIETFNSQWNAMGELFLSPFTLNMPADVTVEIFNKLGNTTGTFNTEMVSMYPSGPPLGVMIRESPTMASVGQTTITAIGGGLYHIESFFDVFLEISYDGGAQWLPPIGTEPYPIRMTLEQVPEPSICGLAVLAVVLMTLRGTHRMRE